MSDWMTAQIGPLVASVLYAVVGTATMVVLFWVVEKLTPFSLRKEISEDQNVALGVILGAFLIALGLIVSAAIQG